MDKEKIELAFKCVDSLAAGLDPISGKILPKDSAINQGDVVRALFYARSIIGQYRTKSAQPQQPMVQVLPVRAKDPDIVSKSRCINTYTSPGNARFIFNRTTC